MSSSCTSSDEEFESADEGEEEVNIHTTSSSHNEPILEDSTSSFLNPSKEAIIEKHEACQEEKVSTLLIETTHQSYAEERKEACTSTIKNLEETVKELDVADVFIANEPNSVQEMQEENVRESNSNNVTQSIDDSVKLDSNIPVTQITQDLVALKSRNVGRAPSRAKPSLGAKKLGAVKIHQPNTSAVQPEVRTSTQSSTWEPAGDVHSASISLAKSSSQPAPSEPSESNTWGWFAPPKSILSSVTSLTTQILSTVENGLNIPEPEELAKEDLEELDEPSKQIEKKEPEKTGILENKGLGFGLFGGVSNLTRLVETTSTSLFATGLDTLESIGKKTIDVLQQTDPGFKKTRAALVNPLAVSSQEKICLSQVLREAKDSNEFNSSEPTPSNAAIPSAPSFSSLIELHYGVTHLEALQILSQQWNTRVAPQIRRLTTQRRAVFDEISRICSDTIEAEDDDCDPDEFNPQQLEENINSLLDRVSLIVPSDKLLNAIRVGMLDDSDIPENGYASALDSLALVTSRGIEMLRKSAELLLMMPKPSNPVAEAKLEAESLNQITSLVIVEITRLGNRHAALLIKNGISQDRHSTTDLFYECAKCRLMIQDALKLMIPILQSRVV